MKPIQLINMPLIAFNIKHAFKHAFNINFTVNKHAFIKSVTKMTFYFFSPYVLLLPNSVL